MENIKQKIVEIITHTHKTPLEQADEILCLFSVSGRSEQLVSFLKWYVKDEIMRKEKELVTSIVGRYLNETNCH